MDEFQHENKTQNREQPEPQQTRITGAHMHDQSGFKHFGSRDEEVAAELANDEYTFMDEENRPQTEARSMYGWIAVGLSILSFFIVPIIFGAAGIVLGFMARRRDAELLGNTAIVIGAISIGISLFISPFV